MEEEELGAQRVFGHKNYVECSRCGTPTDSRSAVVVPGDATQSQSEYEFLCPACRQALADGEQDLPLTLP